MKRFVKYVPKNFVVHGTDYIYFNSKYWYKSYNGKTTKIADQNSARDLVASGHWKEDGPVERKSKSVSAKPLVLSNATVTVENKTQDAPYKSKPFIKYQRAGGDFIHGGYYFTKGLEWFSCDRNEKVENVTNIGFDFSDKNI